jgi:hypothetical protein
MFGIGNRDFFESFDSKSKVPLSSDRARNATVFSSFHLHSTSKRKKRPRPQPTSQPAGEPATVAKSQARKEDYR